MTEDSKPAWTPEFPGQRAPFEPDNTAAMTHGARSPRKIEETARAVSAELLERFPVAADYPETLTALARVEGVTRLMFADIAQNGLYGKDGQFRAALLSRYLTAENSGSRLRSSLGMTPESEASVARDRAAATATTVDIVNELIKQGRATRAQQGPAATDLTALATTEANSDRKD